MKYGTFKYGEYRYGAQVSVALSAFIMLVQDFDYDVVVQEFEHIVTTEVSEMAFFGSTITIRATFPTSAGNLNNLTNVHCEVYSMDNTLLEDVEGYDVIKLADGVYEIEWLLEENIQYAFYGTLGTRVLVGKAKVKASVPA